MVTFSYEVFCMASIHLFCLLSYVSQSFAVNDYSKLFHLKNNHINDHVLCFENVRNIKGLWYGPESCLLIELGITMDSFQLLIIKTKTPDFKRMYWKWIKTNKEIWFVYLKCNNLPLLNNWNVAKLKCKMQICNVASIFHFYHIMTFN